MTLEATKLESAVSSDYDGDANAEDVVQWVTFRLGEELYGVNVIQVQEILRVTDITPVPGSPNYVLGIINLRGNIVTVIDLRLQLNMPTKETTDRTRIVIAEEGDLIVGFRVDSVADVADLLPSQIEASPIAKKEDGKHYISGVTTKESELLILLDLGFLLANGGTNNSFDF
ncbi:MAG: chemotaxis protein CheW [Gammaproteobacteria bacterium]